MESISYLGPFQFWPEKQNISVLVDIGVPFQDYNFLFISTHKYIFAFIYVSINLLIFMHININFKIHIFYKPTY